MSCPKDEHGEERDQLVDDHFNRAIREMSEPRSPEEQRLEEDSNRIKSHVLITPEECEAKGHPMATHWTLPGELEREASHCPICDGGLGVCGVCGAAEIELSQYTCAEYTALHQSHSKEQSESGNQGDTQS